MILAIEESKMKLSDMSYQLLRDKYRNRI